MAQTNFKSYKWVIETLIESGKLGLTLEKLQSLYFTFKREEIRKSEELYKSYGKDFESSGKNRPKGMVPTLGRTTFHGWRISIWREFGLKIDNSEENNRRYVLSNPEAYEELISIKLFLEKLIEDEKRGFERGTLVFSKRGRKPKSVSSSGSMGFVSTEGKEWSEDMSCPQDPTMVDVIQFSMAIGEAMVIDYNKVGKTTPKGQTSVLEPQSLKCINGRWYVLGYLYKYGETDPARNLCVYDVERIKMNEEDEIIPPKYTVNEDFDIYSVIPDDWSEHFDPEKVKSVYIKSVLGIFKNSPFCNAQEKVDLSVGLLHTLYKVYVRPDRDFIIQILSYGDEVRIYAPFKKIPRTDIDLTDDQIGYLRRLQKSVL